MVAPVKNLGYYSNKGEVQFKIEEGKAIPMITWNQYANQFEFKDEAMEVRSSIVIGARLLQSFLPSFIPSFVRSFLPSSVHSSPASHLLQKEGLIPATEKLHSSSLSPKRRLLLLATWIGILSNRLMPKQQQLQLQRQQLQLQQLYDATNICCRAYFKHNSIDYS